MNTYDLCLAWNWELDADFAKLLDSTCRSHRLSLLQITPKNLADCLQSLVNREISFRAFLDRASDADPQFMPLIQWARQHTIYRFNPYEYASRSWDKATMHLLFTNAGIPTPYTIILPPHNDQPTLPSMDLRPLGKNFILKPAHGGGGDGVVTGVISSSQIHAARQQYPADKYLAQFHIVPAQLGKRQAWFRVIYCAGETFLYWWHTYTHVYTPVTADEKKHYRLHPLHDILLSIHKICKLDLFSTEIALTPDGQFIVIDYVNSPIDLRLQSKTPDGVPDKTVQNIAERLTQLVVAHCCLLDAF